MVEFGGGKRLLRWLTLVLGMALVTVGHAEVVRLDLDDGTLVNADLRRGDPQRPAIMLWHGFLQTYRFPIIQSLTNELAANGYTVLAPTLSLGIADRRRSLACDAVHTHGLGDDLAEVKVWGQWLRDQGYQHVVLAGHSTGSLLALIAADAPHWGDSLDGVIALSLGSFSGWSRPAERRADRAQAKRLQQTAPNALGHFHFAFCNGNYVSAPDTFLSYMDWDDARVLDRVHHTPVPVKVILGGTDRHLTPQWRQQLRQAGATVLTVDGADHFFDGVYEFDLLDSFDQALRQLEGTR